MFNKSEILKTAWKRTKMKMETLGYAAHQLRAVFSHELRLAWAQAKAATVRVVRTASQIRHAIFALECKDHWTQADYALRDALTAELKGVS